MTGALSRVGAIKLLLDFLRNISIFVAYPFCDRPMGHWHGTRNFGSRVHLFVTGAGVHTALRGRGMQVQ